MNSSGEADRRKRSTAERELRRLMTSVQPPMAPDKPEADPPDAEEIAAYMRMQDKIDQALFEDGVIKKTGDSPDTDSR